MNNVTNDSSSEQFEKPYASNCMDDLYRIYLNLLLPDLLALSLLYCAML